MLYILILTPECNNKCTYCGGFDDWIMPKEVKYSIRELKDFISMDEEPSIAFYGGEPLLKVDLITKIMEKIYAEHYILQTNGLLLHKLPKDYVKEFSTILVSFDGRKEVHDFYRGNYERVLENVRKIKYFEGELIARMVASRKTNIYEDVKHVLSLGCFTHVHWQIDAVWSSREGFDPWVQSYNRDLTKLLDFWIDEIEAGRFHNIVPFMGIASAFKKPFFYPPCSSGFESFTITTDGKVLACPICPELEWNRLGDIWKGFRKGVDISDPCPKCEFFRFCGARCLFFNRERLWGKDGFELICSTVKNLVNAIKSRIDKIPNIIYPKYLNTTEIIP